MVTLLCLIARKVAGTRPEVVWWVQVPAWRALWVSLSWGDTFHLGRRGLNPYRRTILLERRGFSGQNQARSELLHCCGKKHTTFSHACKFLIFLIQTEYFTFFLALATPSTSLTPSLFRPQHSGILARKTAFSFNSLAFEFMFHWFCLRVGVRMFLTLTNLSIPSNNIATREVAVRSQLFLTDIPFFISLIIGICCNKDFNTHLALFKPM